MPRVSREVRKLPTFALIATLGFFSACSGSKTLEEPKPPAPPPAPEKPAAIAPVPETTAAVTAEEGGEGFTGKGWTTSSPAPLGDPRAVKGGVYRIWVPTFPANLRIAGQESSTDTNFMIGEDVYETLISLDPNTLEYAPSLASHWQLSADKLTLRFRINPKARFSNGETVTADDVIASWAFMNDKTLLDPSRNAQFGRFQKPVAESRYIVSVKVATPDWRNLKDFGTFLVIYPASSLKNLTGAQYLEKNNYAMLPGTGPYIVSDLKKQESITLRRRKDYWGEDEPGNKGLNNFDEIRISVVSDQTLAWEKFKKGELDFFFVNTSSVWVNGMDFDAAQRGLIQRRKVYNNSIPPLQTFAMNTRRPPLDDIRVRKALTLLMDRQKLIEQLFFNEYIPTNSFFEGTVYENPSNPKNLYDPQEALRLLAEAGWKDRDSQGRLVKGGKPLVVPMTYEKSPAVERFLVVYQEDLRKAGVTLELNPVNFETGVQLVRRERQFDMNVRGFTVNFPLDPEQDWHPRLADVNDNNNITGFKDPKIAEIMAKYATAFTEKERLDLMRQLDGVLTSQYHYILLWTAPFKRIAFWNKFGQPAGVLTRIGDWNSDLALGPGAERLWWLDPAKDAQLKKAQADTNIKLPIGTVEERYWLNSKPK